MKILRNPRMSLLQTAKSGIPWEVLSPPTWDPIPHQSSSPNLGSKLGGSQQKTPKFERACKSINSGLCSRFFWRSQIAARAIAFLARATLTGMAMQDYGLGLRVGLKDLPTLRTRIHIKF